MISFIRPMCVLIRARRAEKGGEEVSSLLLFLCDGVGAGSAGLTTSAMALPATRSVRPSLIGPSLMTGRFSYRWLQRDASLQRLDHPHDRGAPRLWWARGIIGGDGDFGGFYGLWRPVHWHLESIDEVSRAPIADNGEGFCLLAPCGAAPAVDRRAGIAAPLVNKNSMSLASIEKATQQLQMIDWGAVTHGHDAPTGDAIFIADAHANAAEKAALEAAQSAAAAAQNEVEQLRRSLNAEKSRNHLLEARASAASAAVERLEKQQTPPPSITKNGDANANGGGRPSVEEQVELVARELQQEADRQVRAATAGSAAAVAAAEREVREAREETSMVRLQLDEAESRRIAAEEARAASDAARAEAEAARNAAMARAAAAEQHAYRGDGLGGGGGGRGGENAQAAQEALEGKLATKRALVRAKAPARCGHAGGRRCCVRGAACSLGG